MTVSAPEPLSAHHRLADFSSDAGGLDDWLKRLALANQVSGASRTYVACDADRVIGYHALAAGGVDIIAAPGRFRRNMPDPIPVVISCAAGCRSRPSPSRFGRALFQDAAKRVFSAADVVGIRGMLVHAISEEAQAFYLALGFERSAIEPMTLMLTLADLRKSVE